MNISIIIPTYCRTQDLRRVLDSVFRQHTPVAEVVVVVGPGDAESLAVAKEWQAKQSALLVVQAERPSVVHAINRGLALATGEVLCLLDDDVWLPETWAGRVTAAYTADAQLGAFGGRDRLKLNQPDCDNPPLAKVVGRFRWNGALQGNHHCGAVVSPVQVDVIKGCNFSFRRAAFPAMQVEPALESQGAEVGWEVDICQRVIRAGYHVVYDNEHYVLHYASPRPEYDDRSNLFSAAWGKRTYNESLMTAKYRSRRELVLLGLGSFLIGSRVQPGLVWGTLLLAKHRSLRVLGLPWHYARIFVQGASHGLRLRQSLDDDARRAAPAAQAPVFSPQYSAANSGAHEHPESPQAPR
ncbi:MAG TPA: glycosyltransferase family 2 protein [Hymenobacter sp.]|jgi:glycosyltransferase involved in cell wall biosynthesis|uniref:glycosyltransferase family 2 protein n=1 Tax=Hymenobacter sp. TaxID=1898978 RepID=UPI002EDA3B2F